MRIPGLAALSLAAACSAPIASDRPIDVQHVDVRGSSAPAAQRAPVIAQLQLRDHRLVVRAGSGALLYDVETRAGTLVAAALSWTDLEQRFPAIAETVRDSTALTIDASLGPTRGERPADRPGRR
jgi:hypothetical protein